MSFLADLKAYIDGELSEERTREVAAALESNAALRAEYESLKSLSSQIQGAVRQHPVAGLEATLSRVQGSSRRHIPWRALGLTAAAIAVVAFSVPLLMQSSASAKKSRVAVTDDGSASDKLSRFDAGESNGSGFGLNSSANELDAELSAPEESRPGTTGGGYASLGSADEWAGDDAEGRDRAATAAESTTEHDAAPGVAAGVGGAARAGSALINQPVARRLILTVSDLAKAASSLNAKLADLKISSATDPKRYARGVAQSERIYRLELTPDQLESLQKELKKIGTVEELTADQMRRVISLQFRQVEQERTELEQRLSKSTSDAEKQEIQAQIDGLRETSKQRDPKPGSVTVEIVLRLKGDGGR